MQVIGISIYPHGKPSEKIVVPQQPKLNDKHTIVGKAFMYLCTGSTSKTDTHSQRASKVLKDTLKHPIMAMLRALKSMKAGLEVKDHQCPITGDYNLRVERGPLAKGETKHFDDCKQRIRITHQPTGRQVVIHYKANA